MKAFDVILNSNVLRKIDSWQQKHLYNESILTYSPNFVKVLYFSEDFVNLTSVGKKNNQANNFCELVFFGVLAWGG